MVARAVIQAYKNILNPQAAKEGTEKFAEAAKAQFKGMTLDEARLVLNLSKDFNEIKADEVEQVSSSLSLLMVGLLLPQTYKTLFEANEIEKGGSYYLQVRTAGRSVMPLNNIFCLVPPPVQDFSSKRSHRPRAPVKVNIADCSAGSAASFCRYSC